MPRLPNAAPKPKAKPKAPRAFNSSLPRATKPPKTKNAKRKKSEFARCYGSKERVEFVKGQNCLIAVNYISTACCNGSTENAHVVNDGTRGAGRKSGFACIAPLCHRHHAELHDLGQQLFEATYDLDLAHCAEATELRWLAVSASRKNHD